MIIDVINEVRDPEQSNRSAAAGITLDQMTAALPDHATAVRAMPYLRSGTRRLTSAADTDLEVAEFSRTLFETMETCWLSQKIR